MENTLRQAARLTLRHIRWVPVAGGIIYLVLWIVAEAGRWAIADKTIVFTLFAIAIALSGFVPLASLSLVVAIPLLQFLGLLYPPSSTTWPMYAAAGFIAVVVAFSAEGIARRLVLPVGVITSVLFASRMMMPSSQEGYWTSWIGGNSAYFISNYPHRENLITLMLAFFIFFVGMWALGIAGRSLLRERAIGRVLSTAETRLVETDFELRLADDRARISRDVHDALAHSLAVIVSQAEGAIALQAKKPKVAADALRNIASVGRTALVDVRNLVERITLTGDDDLASRPTIADLESLVTPLSEIGMDVSLRVIGTPGILSPSHELAVFRIVQESLTNALKHAGRESVARVTLDWQGTGLAVLVTSSSPSQHVAQQETRGVGIEGMKERARLAGGWLTAASSGDGVFIVTAFIPALPAAALEDELVDA
ncbi:hypothetical protein BH10ACT7_BH10ACT7_29240 [soil metagenome]